MHMYCGFDFGTSNTTIGITKHGNLQLVQLENSKPSIRSAIFCDTEHKEWVFGQEGINRYLESASGRLMMSLKSVLGSALMDDETLILNEFISYKKILSYFIRHVKRQAELVLDNELTHVVMGRPVHFHDNDLQKDIYAQQTLKEIAIESGFKEIIFQYEPIAAALVYESQIKKEQLALIIDMGGGTSDFSVIRLQPQKNTLHRQEDILANDGIHIAGTDFDHDLSLATVMPLLGYGSEMQGSSSTIEVPSSYFHDLTTWHMLSQLYSAKIINHVKGILARAYSKPLLQRLLKVLQQRAGHHILYAVEMAKQKLSDVDHTKLSLDFIEAGLEKEITRSTFNEIIMHDVEKIINKTNDTLLLAGVSANEISAIFYTGGSTKIPLIHSCINPLFENAEIVQGDAFGSVGMGLTIEAQKIFAMR